MISRVSAIARARGQALHAARRYASGGVVPASSAGGGGGAMNAFARGWYNLFGTSTIRYASFFTVGAVLAELGTNKLTDTLWELNNAGKTYGSVDWSKFDPEEESEGGEEEEEEEEGEDDEE